MGCFSEGKFLLHRKILWHFVWNILDSESLGRQWSQVLKCGHLSSQTHWVIWQFDDGGNGRLQSVPFQILSERSLVGDCHIWCLNSEENERFIIWHLSALTFSRESTLFSHEAWAGRLEKGNAGCPRVRGQVMIQSPQLLRSVVLRELNIFTLSGPSLSSDVILQVNHYLSMPKPKGKEQEARPFTRPPHWAAVRSQVMRPSVLHELWSIRLR